MSTPITRRLMSVAAACAFTVAGLGLASPAPAVDRVDPKVDDTTIIEDGREATRSVPVTDEAAPTGITPAPVTFPDHCTVVVPSTPHVAYTADFGRGESSRIDAGTYSGTRFDNDGSPVTFYAEPEEGFELTAGVRAAWTYKVKKNCFPDVVKLKATCGKLTFTNLLDESIVVVYGKDAGPRAGGDFTLAPGKSRTVKTKRARLLFIASSQQGSASQDGYVTVPQKCGTGGGDQSVSGGSDNTGSGDGVGGNGSDHPDVAPAAGVSQREHATSAARNHGPKSKSDKLAQNR